MNNFGKKQLSGAIFLFLVFGGGFLLLRDSLGTAQFEKTAVTGRTGGLFADEAEKDSDGDGLLDWEEGLWKTDAGNADTDSDGTMDGEEVRNKRNPLVAGPEDIITSLEGSPLAEVFADSAEEKDLTLTDIFARDFLTGYFALSERGAFSGETRERFLTSLVSSIGELPAKKYTVADLTTTPKGDSEAFRLYGNALGGIALAYRPLSGQKELEIINDAIKYEDEARLAALAPIIADYEAMLRAQASITVPLAAHELHLEILNANEAVRGALAEIQNLFVDPFGGAAALKTYRAAGAEGASISKDLQALFAKHGIIFNNNEPGRIFN